MKDYLILSAIAASAFFCVSAKAAEPDTFCQQATRDASQYLPVWQSLFRSVNPMEDAYFKEHLVVDNISINCLSDSVVARVDYHANVAWARIPAHDQFPVFKEKPTTVAAYNALTIRPPWDSDFMRIRPLATLHYATEQEAQAALTQAMKGVDAYGVSYSYYVPGQVPRSNGDPYLMQHMVLDKPANRCVFGTLNLRTGAIATHEGACRVS